MNHKESFADLLKKEKERSAGKLRSKIPDWADTEGIIVPSSLSLEQCSSSAAASHKALVASDFLRERGIDPSQSVIADLTGGLGVDCAAFAGIFKKVIYNERNAELVDAARHNFSRLGFSNIEVRRAEASEAIDSLAGVSMVYLDPARRNRQGNKVFRLEDCQPDLLALKGGILEKVPVIMAKLSPMADLSVLMRELSPQLHNLHIIGFGGECKEILCILQKDNSAQPRITVTEGGSDFIFTPDEEKTAVFRGSGEISRGMKIYEPCSALLKSGAFNLISERFEISKIGISTHLYCSEDRVIESSLFKRFTVSEVLPFCNGTFAEIKSRKIRAGVSARNVPVRSEELAKKAGILPGEDAHIFAVTKDGASNSTQRLVIICHRDI